MDNPMKILTAEEQAKDIAWQLRIFYILFILMALPFPISCATGYLSREYPAVPVSWSVGAYLVGLPLYWMMTISIKRPDFSMWKHAAMFILGMVGLLLVAFATLATMMIICLGMDGAC